ncbi:hypothetical protein IPZ77_17970 [Streptomyces sp. XC 2026]|nr:hypothetical protein IPZ77_17970 [Streptomyces sp. XC 2026]
MTPMRGDHAAPPPVTGEYDQRFGPSLQARVPQLPEREAADLTLEETAAEAGGIAARSSVTADDVRRVIAETREARQ